LNYVQDSQKRAKTFLNLINLRGNRLVWRLLLKKIIVMRIKDLHGKGIEITDLEKAIKQAETFKGYSHQDKSFAEFDKRQKAYWTDIYEKLLILKKKQNEHSISKD